MSTNPTNASSQGSSTALAAPPDQRPPLPDFFSSDALPSAVADEYAIRIRRLQHYYGEGENRKQILFDNSLDIRRGEIVIMTGPSGSGKTTLLTLIGTLRKVQAGRLEVLGHKLHEAGTDELIQIRKKIGFIFQHHNLFYSLSALQNVRLSLELFDLAEDEMNRRSAEVLSQLELGHRQHYKPGNLSGGQRQRVAIARGLVHQPQLVLADEPTAALDKEATGKVIERFQRLALDQKCTILIVTHDDRIHHIAHRIVNMVDGRITAKPLEVLQRCDYFRDLTEGMLTDVANKMVLESLEAGSIVFRQGDPGDRFYIIRTGTVDVIQETADGKAQRIATLGPADFFGEVALMQDIPRTATIRCTTDCEFYTLDKELFKVVQKHSHVFAEELARAVARRQERKS
jgi:putative ABC transport system ATP-binding protein